MVITGNSGADCNSHQIDVTPSATRFAAHAFVHQRNSGRGFARESSAKNADTIASEESWSMVLQRHNRSAWVSSISSLRAAGAASVRTRGYRLPVYHWRRQG